MNRRGSLPAPYLTPASDRSAVPPRTAVRILVRGQVQGVGFRPFVFRLARQCRLGGGVRNAALGVIIEVEGSREDIVRFQEQLVSDAPTAAQIDLLTIDALPLSGRAAFAIEPSDPLAPPVARLPRDLATCADCRRDIFDASDRRRGHPFTNCTACGPRYSILEAMPYDRSATTMRFFPMCAACSAEYRSPADRRFHAQPNACPACGPQVGLWDREGRTMAGPAQAIRAAAELLRRGQVVALKGLGGFQLLVRADDPEAVQRLRQRKHRPSKPLAVMVASLRVAEHIAALGQPERRLLMSAQNPIVLVEAKGHGLQPVGLAGSVAPRVGTLGLFLPTTPLHHLLLTELNLPVVATSGNRSEEPIVTDERGALRRLAGIADAFLIHDRPIVRGVDDSVLRVIAGEAVTFRLARGYAPLPLPALEAAGPLLPPILATGGHQKAAAALWTGTQAVLGQHIGDLDHPDTRDAFERATHDGCRLYQCHPAVTACDLHPDYFTTRWALGRNIPVFQLQHHHAHAVACMAEHNLLDHEVLALTWDGTGYGPDGTIWGGEILRARANAFGREASLLPFPVPGGEAAIRHPARTAVGLLWTLLGEEALLGEDHMLRRLGLTVREAGVLAAMIRKGINTPWTSSVGRLFDAVSALVLGAHNVSYEGEAAVWLEAAADAGVSADYPLPVLPAPASPHSAGNRSVARSDWRPMLSAVLSDLACDVEPGVIAARFHNGLARWAAAVAAEQPFGDVVLSGGCFQNRLLAERIREALAALGRSVYLPGQVPPGDGGLAVGQLAVAMTRLRSHGLHPQ